VRTALLLAAVAACGGKLPETRYYQLAQPVASVETPVDGRAELPVVVIEPLTAEGAYDDDRIVYRTSPYRLDYYQYHRWSAAPGALLSGYLEQALERTGRFRGVVRELDPGAAVVIGGRVIALEEIDDSRTRWRGRVALELRVSDARTNAVLWTEQLEDSEPLAAQTPEGLARAVSIAMTRIVTRCAPAIADLANRHALARTR
jgi:ABC-type uncharacterized transport system auxiliary subunit